MDVVCLLSSTEWGPVSMGVPCTEGRTNVAVCAESYRFQAEVDGMMMPLLFLTVGGTLRRSG